VVVGVGGVYIRDRRRKEKEDLQSGENHVWTCVWGTYTHTHTHTHMFMCGVK
jgi:hypothetical protein